MLSGMYAAKPPTPATERIPLWRLLWGEVQEDKLLLRASALSYQTLSYLVPLLAIILAVLSGPVFQDQRDRIMSGLAQHIFPDPLTNRQESFWGDEDPPKPEESVNNYRKNAVEEWKRSFQTTVGQLSAHVGKISVFSCLILLFIAGKLFKTVEDCFNVIWRFDKGRSIFMKAALTTAMIVWVPTFIAVSIALSGLIKEWPLLNHYLFPLLLTTIGFTAFYMIMPHGKISFRAAATGGIFGALVWEISKFGFQLYCSMAVQGAYKLYGSLGLIPMFFLWVWISWVVVLVGAELSYIVQHYGAVRDRWETLEREKRQSGDKADHEAIIFQEASLLPVLTMAAAIEIARRFRLGDCPGGLPRSELAKALGVETGLLQRALVRLNAAHIIVQTGNGENSEDPRYLPARDPAHLDLAAAGQAAKGPPPPLGQGFAWEKAQELLTRLEREGANPLSHETLADLFPKVERIKEQSMQEGAADAGAETAPSV